MGFQGKIQKSLNRRMQIVIGAQIFWIGVVCLVGAWWGVLLLRQAAKIAELEVGAGVASSEAHLAWLKTQRMLYWESTTFFVLAVLSSGFLFWLYWLDMKRARSIQAFFASVTHELRTPLTSIRLQAESIAELCEESQRTLVGRLLEDTSRLEGQVERTLELARLEGGGPVFVQQISLKPWLTRLVQSWQESYGKKAEILLSAQVLTVQADPTALQIVLKNLLENSMKHSQKETVRVSIDAVMDDQPHKNTKIIFKDDGGGFSGATRDLGKLFHRGSASQGSGVGLYLVRTLMQRMGGNAHFETSKEGFKVKLFLKNSTESVP